MIPRFAVFFVALLALLSTPQLQAQTPLNKPLVGGKSPQDPIPGLIVRVHLGRGGMPSWPTHLLCIVQSGDDWFKGGLGGRKP